MTALQPQTLVDLAEARGMPLSAERAAELVAAAAGLFAFVRELDEVITPEVPPATVFRADD